MKTRHVVALLLAFALSAPLVLAAAGKRTPDVLPPARRQVSVDTAERLTKPPVPAPVAPELRSPFNPPGFDKPDPAPVASGGGTRPGQTPSGGAPVAPAAPAGSPSDREIVETLAARIPSTASMMFGGKTLLVVGKNRLEVGTRFTVAYNGQDYELELTAITSTTFTLRYHNEEFTRPIRTR